MAASGAELAERFEKANAEFIQAVEGLSDAQWTQKTGAEGWSVGVTVHHVAEDHPVITGMLRGLATAGEASPITPQALDAMNAEHAQRAASCTKAETLAMLSDGGKQAAELLRGLKPAELARSAPMAFLGGQDMSALQMAEGILIGHIGEHLANIRAVG